MKVPGSSDEIFAACTILGRSKVDCTAPNDQLETRSGNSISFSRTGRLRYDRISVHSATPSRHRSLAHMSRSQCAESMQIPFFIVFPFGNQLNWTIDARRWFVMLLQRFHLDETTFCKEGSDLRSFILRYPYQENSCQRIQAHSMLHQSEDKGPAGECHLLAQRDHNVII